MRYLCKESYYVRSELIFEKDTWYTEIECTNRIYASLLSRKIGGSELESPTVTIKKYFYSVDELREIEINKIIDGTI
tara:strand:+ start:349 stop:579 length:231 start_codon:yes stop_codon:yes gene_type:complete